MVALRANDLDIKDFIDTVRNYHFPDNALQMVFTPAEARFNFYNFDEFFLSITDQGRIFSPEGELKWRRVNQILRAVYLGVAPGPEKLEDRSTELKPLTSQYEEFFLWGVRTDLKDEWIEQQIPHRFVYPLDGKNYLRGRVTVIMESWVDVAGFPMFRRYHSIKEISGE
jgi:hypothetical protein